MASFTARLLIQKYKKSRRGISYYLESLQSWWKVRGALVLAWLVKLSKYIWWSAYTFYAKCLYFLFNITRSKHYNLIFPVLFKFKLLCIFVACTWSLSTYFSSLVNILHFFFYHNHLPFVALLRTISGILCFLYVAVALFCFGFVIIAFTYCVAAVLICCCDFPHHALLCILLTLLISPNL